MKIGILTLYYKNYNYGGLLQAYALQKFIANLGSETEQISYVRDKRKLWKKKIKALITNDKGVFSLIRVRLNMIFYRQKLENDEQYINTMKKFDNFMDMIPHSCCTDSINAKKVFNEYDCVVVGSDQVWNPLFVSDDFFLPCVNSNVLKMSYAASIRVSSLEKNDKKRIKEYLERFQYISVREDKAKRLLESIGIDKAIDVLPDPTFLLKVDEWRELEKKSELCIKEKYILLYLVRNKVSIKLAENFANKKGYKIIQIQDPGYYIKKSVNEIKLKQGIGPIDFIYLIDNAELVLANSFHGTAFSFIFNKPFYVYGNQTDDRKITLLKKMKLEDRLIDEKFNFEKEGSLCLDFSTANKIMELERENVIQKFNEIMRSINDDIR